MRAGSSPRGCENPERYAAGGGTRVLGKPGCRRREEPYSRQLRGIEPLSKVMSREAELQRGKQPDDEVSRSPLVMRELTEMVIAENVPGIIRRFNACDCEKCMSELARLTAEEIPARYMKMPELADLNWSGFSSDERMLIDSLKKNAVTVMIRLMIANKKRNFH